MEHPRNAMLPSAPPLRVGVRYFCAADADAVLGVEALSFGVPWGRARLDGQRRRYGCETLVAVVAGAVVGHAVVVPLGRAACLRRLAVLPGCRRRGVGSALMAKVASLAAGRRSGLSLFCPEDCLPAHVFFRSMGLRATAVVEGYYDGQDAPDGMAAYRFEGGDCAGR